jgi:lambda family phage portal protein
MSQQSVIVDTSGKPFSMPGQRRARADGGWSGVGGPTSTSFTGFGGSVYPYDASNVQTQEMGDWFPVIRSPDSEINFFRDRMVARSRDLARNSGWAAGGITRILDNVIGTHLRLSATPDYRALALRFGIKAFDAVWADEFRRATEAFWRSYTESPGRWSDVTRQWTMGQQFRIAMRHKLVDGDGLVVSYWMPERVGYGGADYATAFLLVDPDRLSNPYQMVDTKTLRGGVEIDYDGVPVAYHIRSAEQNDWYNAVESMIWERIPREDDDGWRRVIHDFDADRAGQHRGIGVFTPVIGHMRMLAKYYGVELQAATIASMFGTYVKSPYDPALAQDAMAGEQTELGAYQEMRADWAKERPAMLDGARIPTLAPGEDIVGVSSQHPHSNFSAFAHEMLCVFASATGISVEQVTQDWSRTNYSSARAALMETWKTLMRRRHQFTTNTAGPMYGVWLQEAMERGELPLPAGAPDYIEAAASYSRAKWLGPARGWVDPTREPQGTILRLEAGVTTLEQEAAEQGTDWEEVLQQRCLEQQKYEEAGVPMPKWANVSAPSLDTENDEERAGAR